jgi:hypothetical protein
VRKVNGINQLTQSSCGGMRGGRIAKANKKDGKISKEYQRGKVKVRGCF